MGFSCLDVYGFSVVRFEQTCGVHLHDWDYWSNWDAIESMTKSNRTDRLDFDSSLATRVHVSNSARRPWSQDDLIFFPKVICNHTKTAGQGNSIFAFMRNKRAIADGSTAAARRSIDYSGVTPSPYPITYSFVLGVTQGFTNKSAVARHWRPVRRRACSRANAFCFGDDSRGPCKRSNSSDVCVRLGVTSAG